jgi:hypothetical protein
LLYPVSCYFSVIFSPSILIINFYIICHQKDGIITLGTIPPTNTDPNIMFTMQFIFLYITINNNKSNKFTRLFILNFSQSIYLILHKIYFLFKCITHKKILYKDDRQVDQTCLRWPSKGTVKYGHIWQVVA